MYFWELLQDAKIPMAISILLSVLMLALATQLVVVTWPLGLMLFCSIPVVAEMLPLAHMLASAIPPVTTILPLEVVQADTLPSVNPTSLWDVELVFA
jgi:hypothetical protein